MTEYTYYKLFNKKGDCDEIYVGRTHNIEQRKYLHTRSCEEFHKIQPVHLFILNNGGISDWDMEVIKKKYCKDEMESFKHEKDILNKLKNNGEKLLNKNEPFLTEEEKKEKKIMYSLNRYYEYKEKNKIDQKKYREKNKETLKVKKKEYYDKNKTKLNETRKNKPKLYCECCEIFIARTSVSNHLKTHKHFYNSECRIE